MFLQAFFIHAVQKYKLYRTLDFILDKSFIR